MTLDVKMECFIPEYLPSIGQIDTFIKVPRPDGKPDGLGLTQLDEPATVESDRTVLELQLRAISKKKNADPITVYTNIIIVSSFIFLILLLIINYYYLIDSKY